jgi:DNA-binding MarR family transcriptional regulator
LSSDSQEKRAELTRELRQFNGLGASFFRAAAARIGMTVTDMQVMDILDLIGTSTAGQLADLTGLTTGAITRILDRLEEAGLVRRERDLHDGRKVIVRLEGGKDEMHKVRSILDSVGNTWDEVASRYDDEQIAFLLEFLKHSNQLSRKELVRLQEAPSGERGIFSSPLEDQESGRLVVSCGISRLSLRADGRMTEFYQACFEGPLPNVKTKEGADLAGLEVKGGFSMISLDLPVPSGVVPIQISGGASEITIRCPAGATARAHFKGWISELVFDDQTFSGVGNNVRLQSPGFDPIAPCYDIAVTSYASKVTITFG